MKAHKLSLNGRPDDGPRLDAFCERRAASEFEAGARLRALAVQLAKREELVVTGVAYEDESLELEVALAADRFRQLVTIDRDSTGGGCQLSWEQWANIGDDPAAEKTTQMILAVVMNCAASR
ncbi:MAG: hypothetical protein ACLPKE_17000 [Streptosporangiaceae bacterium]